MGEKKNIIINKNSMGCEGVQRFGNILFVFFFPDFNYIRFSGKELGCKFNSKLQYDSFSFYTLRKVICQNCLNLSTQRNKTKIIEVIIKIIEVLIKRCKLFLDYFNNLYVV